ncbi:MAG: phosphate ABC transporter ATP-binding protein PstB [Deltaproteobacteria bacterium]|nr:phosphate ABC transporter ATP-binding protein PstB [Deltaproteobacteria bacterium]
MEERSAIVTKGVSLWYNDFRALDSVSIFIPAFSIMAIIGPSGCGKSSFLRCLNRMNDLIDGAKVTGSIKIFGEEVLSTSCDVVELRRRVGMVFQKSNPFPKTVFENVAFGLKLKGIRDREFLLYKVEKSLRMAGLWDEIKDRLNHSALDLSGGQQQRLCIARALAVDPSVLLMDEPASALDPKSTAKIEELILELKKTVTIIIVTHNLQQAKRISDHCAFFLDGRCEEFGPTAKIFGQPDKQSTSDYVFGKFG